MKTTNYHNTFFEVAADCPAQRGEVPQHAASADAAAVASASAVQFAMIAEAPYTYTSDDVIFRVHQVKHGVCQ